MKLFCQAIFSLVLLCADPLGHVASMDLHSFSLGDPINRFDPTGRFGKGNFQQGFQDLQAAGHDLYTAGTWAREDAGEFDVAYDGNQQHDEASPI
jgi:hypothetical protein